MPTLAADADKLRGVTSRWADLAVQLVETHPGLGLVGSALPAGATVPTVGTFVGFYFFQFEMINDTKLYQLSGWLGAVCGVPLREGP
jgi:hypothetical protein